MATIEGLTKARMLDIEAAAILESYIDPTTKHLILVRHDGTEIDAGLAAAAISIEDTNTVDLEMLGDASLGYTLRANVKPDPITAAIPDGADLNTYLTPGVYTSLDVTMARTGSNYPGVGASEAALDANRYQGRLTVTNDPSGLVYQEWRDLLNQRWSRSYWTATATWTAPWTLQPRAALGTGVIPNSFLQSPEVAFTPVLQAATTNPNLGTSALKQGFYTEVAGLIHWHVFLQAGGTGIAAGSGAYNLAPPVPPLGAFPILAQGWVYNGLGFRPMIMDSNNGRMIRMDGSYVDHTNGISASGHIITLGGVYRKG